MSVLSPDPKAKLMRSITIRIVDQFGKTTAHPVCAAAHVFASIAGTKTLSEANLQRIRLLGYEIQLDAAPAIAAGRQMAPQIANAVRGAAFLPSPAQISAGLSVAALGLR